MSFAETINNEEKYNNFEKVFKKECNSLKDEKEKADCNAKANKGTIEKEFTDLKGKKGKLHTYIIQEFFNLDLKENQLTSLKKI